MSKAGEQFICELKSQMRYCNVRWTHVASDVANTSSTRLDFTGLSGQPDYCGPVRGRKGRFQAQAHRGRRIHPPQAESKPSRSISLSATSLSIHYSFPAAKSDNALHLCTNLRTACRRRRVRTAGCSGPPAPGTCTAPSSCSSRNAVRAVRVSQSVCTCSFSFMPQSSVRISCRPHA